MKEARDIVKAFYKAKQEGKKTLLATVVHVDGSSYRRPGARMLVTEDGFITGAISGGCLESDVLRKALLSMRREQSTLITYDTNEDDPSLGVQLGCNGIVHILLEPINEKDPLNPICLLKQISISRKDAVLVTFFSFDRHHQQGTSLIYRDGKVTGPLPFDRYKKILPLVRDAYETRSSSLQVFTNEVSTVNAFIEFIAPSVSLVIAGAGNDAQPLAAMASMIGWNITVTDGRSTHANPLRFPEADNLIVSKAAAILPQLEVDDNTAFVLMTHNYNYDLELLQHLLSVTPGYIGVLGPQKKLDRMITDMSDQGFVLTPKQLSGIYGPVGLDIGAETAEEIAIAVIAEIKATLAGRSAGTLRDKHFSIHERVPTFINHE